MKEGRKEDYRRKEGRNWRKALKKGIKGRNRRMELKDGMEGRKEEIEGWH